MPLIPPAIRHRLRRGMATLVLPNPTGVPGAQHSVILYDDHGAPGDRLLELALEASRRARGMNLRWISERIAHTPRWPDRCRRVPPFSSFAQDFKVVVPGIGVHEGPLK